MQNQIFNNISKIIERDSKSTTYKFALLRGVIEMILDNTPYISFSSNQVHLPTGQLIEKWMLYYYPILESSLSIPQINGNINLAFSNQLNLIISDYKNNGGFSAFYNDLKNKGIPNTSQRHFIDLSIKLQETITKMPMKYIGRSISNDYYSIFNFEQRRALNKTSNSIDIEFLIKNFGSFSIPKEYYEAFQVLGSFISGQDSILFKWAEFSVNASGKRLSIEHVVNEVLRNPITERDVKVSKELYKSILQKEGRVRCVWTGKTITRYDVDHMIPFSVWKNNDLWNLLPSQATTNNQKRDKIPSADSIENHKELILYYWDLINKNLSQRFQKEIQVALLGNIPFLSWQDTAIKQLQTTCNYLITNRGYEEWKI
jgi:hypothetical protein